jgi:hypothetical protein
MGNLDILSAGIRADDTRLAMRLPASRHAWVRTCRCPSRRRDNSSQAVCQFWASLFHEPLFILLRNSISHALFEAGGQYRRSMQGGMTMMKRSHIRELKRAVSSQHDAEAMQSLLERSVRFGHRKLALLRCLQAEQMGIDVPAGVLSYCQQVMEKMPADAVDKLIRQAAIALRNVRGRRTEL